MHGALCLTALCCQDPLWPPPSLPLPIRGSCLKAAGIRQMPPMTDAGTGLTRRLDALRKTPSDNVHQKCLLLHWFVGIPGVEGRFCDTCLTLQVLLTFPASEECLPDPPFSRMNTFSTDCVLRQLPDTNARGQ